MGEAVMAHPLYGSELGSERSNFGLLTQGPAQTQPTRGLFGPCAALKENVLRKYLVKGVFKKQKSVNFQSR